MSIEEKDLIDVRTQIIQALVMLDEIQQDYPATRLDSLEESLLGTVRSINAYLGINQ